MIDLRHVLEQLMDLALFPEKLLVVVEVLVLATAAFSEEGARRFDAKRGGFDDLDEIALTKIGMVAVDAGFDGFGGEGEGDDDDPIVDAAEAVALIGEGVDVEFDNLVIGEGFGGESLWGGGGIDHAAALGPWTRGAELTSDWTG